MLVTNYKLPQPLLWARSQRQLKKIQQYRKQHYQISLPNMKNIMGDNYDQSALVLYTSKNQRITSTARLVLDNQQGLPEDDVFPSQVEAYRKSGKRLAELGRFIIKPSSYTLFKLYYQTIFMLAIRQNIDVILIVMEQKHVAQHQKSLGVKVLSQDIGAGYCEGKIFACVAWEIDKTQDRILESRGKS